MDLQDHLGTALPLAGVLYLASGDAAAAGAFAAAAVLIDVDHLVDYWRETGLNRDWARFFGYFEAREPRHSYLPLHAWEWPAILAVGAAVGAAPGWAWGWVGGMLAHLILDQRYNRLHPSAYFFAHRYALGFESRCIYDDTRAPFE
jgi:hypothetical protein